jgi:hypothetical protein
VALEARACASGNLGRELMGAGLSVMGSRASGTPATTDTFGPSMSWTRALREREPSPLMRWPWHCCYGLAREREQSFTPTEPIKLQLWARALREREQPLDRNAGVVFWARSIASGDGTLPNISRFAPNSGRTACAASSSQRNRSFWAHPTAGGADARIGRAVSAGLVLGSPHCGLSGLRLHHPWDGSVILDSPHGGLSGITQSQIAARWAFWAPATAGGAASRANCRAQSNWF